MPNITMDDFIDECLTGKKPKRKRKKVIEDKPIDISSIFEDDNKSDDAKGKKSVIDTKDAKEKTSKDDVEEQEPDENKTKDEDIVLSLILNIDDDKKVKKYTKESFVDVPLNSQSILKEFGLDMDQISAKANEPAAPSVDAHNAPPAPGSENKEENDKYNKFRLSAKEFLTSGAGSEKVELSWRRDGSGNDAVETAEVITSNGSIPFTDSPDPLNSALQTFDRIYYNDIVTKIREKLEDEGA